MARSDAGTATVSSAGTAVQITTSIAAGSRVRGANKIRSIALTPRANNSGAAMYLGGSNVSSTYGHRIEKGDTFTITFSTGDDGTEGGGDDFQAYYVDADTSGDKADWTVVW